MKLITLENLKLDLGVTGADQDATLERLNEKASAEVEEFVGYPIARAARTHVVRLREPSGYCLIPFVALQSVAKITVEGDVWLDTAATPPIDPGKGFGFTSWGTIRAPYGRAFVGEVEIAFTSGYLLEGAGRDLPLAFENAVAEIVKQRLHAIGRDPNIRAEAVPGVYSVTFGGDTPSATGVSTLVEQLLAPHRLVRVS